MNYRESLWAIKGHLLGPAGLPTTQLAMSSPERIMVVGGLTLRKNSLHFYSPPWLQKCPLDKMEMLAWQIRGI